MTTTLNIHNYADIKSDFIISTLKSMFDSFGEIEITIKPKAKTLNNTIANRIEKVEKGEHLMAFTSDEFDELNKQLLSGIVPNKSNIRKLSKYEKSINL